MKDDTPRPALGLPQPLSIPKCAFTVLDCLLVALSCTLVAAFLYSAARRIGYPFEYDWIEDGVLTSVRHLRQGLPLYQAPSVAFTPYLYTPVYLYTAAALASVVGAGYAALRLLSILATLGCFGLVYALVFAEVRRRLAAVVAVGFFAACYPVVQGSFDVGRVDMLYLFFVLCALYATRHLHPAVAALLWVVAFQTKQGVLPVALLALCHDWPRPRRVLTGLAAFVAGLATSVLWLAQATHRWYLYYVFGTAGGFGFVQSQAADFFRADLLRPCGIALLLVFAAWLAAPPSLRGRPLSFYALGSVGMVGFTGYLRAHRGANVNSLLPMYAWIAVLLGLSLGRLLLVAQARDSRYADVARALVLSLAGLQLMAHLYSPRRFLPTTRQRADRDAFERQLRAIPGDVLVLSHPEDAVLAGKPLFAGSESIGAVVDAPDRAVGDRLMRQYSALLRGGSLRAVVLDISAEQYLAYPRTWMPRDFLSLYPLRVPVEGADDDPLTSEPRWIYLPCSALSVALRLEPRLAAGGCAGHE